MNICLRSYMVDMSRGKSRLFSHILEGHDPFFYRLCAFSSFFFIDIIILLI